MENKNQYKWLMRATSAQNMCVVCTPIAMVRWPGWQGAWLLDSAQCKMGPYEGKLANLYADYSQHWPQVIIKCLPRVIYICGHTKHNSSKGNERRFRPRPYPFWPRGVAAFNTIIEYSTRASSQAFVCVCVCGGWLIFLWSTPTFCFCWPNRTRSQTSAVKRAC